MTRNNKYDIYKDPIDPKTSLDTRMFGPIKVGFAYLKIYLKDLVVLRVKTCKHWLWFGNVYDILQRIARNSQPGTWKEIYNIIAFLWGQSGYEKGFQVFSL